MEFSLFMEGLPVMFIMILNWPLLLPDFFFLKKKDIFIELFFLLLNVVYCQPKPLL